MDVHSDSSDAAAAAGNSKSSRCDAETRGSRQEQRQQRRQRWLGRVDQRIRMRMEKSDQTIWNGEAMEHSDPGQGDGRRSWGSGARGSRTERGEPFGRAQHSGCRGSAGCERKREREIRRASNSKEEEGRCERCSRRLAVVDCRIGGGEGNSAGGSAGVKAGRQCGAEWRAIGLCERQRLTTRSPGSLASVRQATVVAAAAAPPTAARSLAV